MSPPAAASTTTMLLRGFAKRCARCGGGHLYQGWFRMLERCPHCGMKFEREEGFFTGAYLINFAITEGLMFLVLMGYVAWKSQNPDAPWAGPLLLGGFFAIVAPLAFYPFARAIWTAIHLALAPLEPYEIAEAETAVDAARRQGRGPSSNGSTPHRPESASGPG